MKITARVLAGFLCLSVLGGCQQASFPEVHNPDQLIKDCDDLLAAGQNRMLPPAQWPDSVRELKPVYVCINDTDVMIATQAGGDQGARGFFVSHGTPFAGHQKLSTTSNPAIFHFELVR